MFSCRGIGRCGAPPRHARPRENHASPPDASALRIRAPWQARPVRRGHDAAWPGWSGRRAGPRRELRGIIQRSGQQVVRIDQPVTEAQGQRLFTPNPSAGQQQIGRGLAADGRRQGHRQGEPMMEPQAREVGAEAAARCGHAEVCREREPEAAADCRTLHGGHHGQRRRKESQRSPVERRDVLVGADREVETGTEVLAFGGEDDSTAPIRFAELLVRRSHRLDQRCIKEVVRRPAQGDDTDVLVVPLDGKIVAHESTGTRSMSSRLRQ